MTSLHGARSYVLVEGLVVLKLQLVRSESIYVATLVEDRNHRFNFAMVGCDH